MTTFVTTVEKAALIGAFLLSFLSFKRRKHLALLAAVMLALLLTGCGTELAISSRTVRQKELIRSPLRAPLER